MQIRKLNLVVAIVLTIVLNGCSLKKNTMATRQWRAFTTRYNIYFNGKEAYKGALSDFEKNYEDDYSSTLFLHPVSSLADKEVKANAGFDRAIEKSQKAIKLRSIAKRPARNPRKANDPAYKAYLKRSEFNPFLHNAWMLMGRSQFYKGDFLSANATFLYITRHFYWLPETVAESQLWMARCYTEMGWMYEAENTLSAINPQKLPSAQTGWYHTVMASYLLKKGNSKEAIPHLQEAIKSQKNKAQKARMTFLLGQLHQQNGNQANAYDCFAKVMKMNPSYRTYFNASIAQTDVMPTGNTRKIEKKLNKLLRDSRNKEYLDQIYYAKGNLQLAQKDTLKALEMYKQALKESTRNGKEKATAALRLGVLAFGREDYLTAQKAYAEALAILDKNYPDYARISQLSGVLDNLSSHAETVFQQDSLLKVAAMPHDEQMRLIQLRIDELIKREKEEQEAARRSEYEDSKGNYQGPDISSVKPVQQMTNSGDKSWYFYNKFSVQAGKSEFQRKWGSRKPEDDWRRRNKSASMIDSDMAATETEQSNNTDNKQNTTPEQNILSDDQQAHTSADSIISDPKDPQYYIQQLPLTEEAKENSHKLIQEGLFNMATIIEQQLENLPLAIKTFLELDNRYPQNEHKLDVYYEIYLMYMRQNDLVNAELYKQKILHTFPSSNYATALSDPDYVKNLHEMDSKQNSLYEETYQAYLNGDSKKVHNNYEFVVKTWPLSSLMPNFLFLHALSYATEKDSKSFKENLEKLTALYNQSQAYPLAEKMLSGLQAGRKINDSGNISMRGMIWDTRLSNDSMTQINDSTAVPFKLEPTGAHLLVLAFQTDSVQVNELLFNIARYNFTNFMVKDFDLETITFNELTMLVIKGFHNFGELNEYRLRMALPGGMTLPQGVTPVMISEANFRLLLEGRSFNDYFSFMEKCSEAAVEAQ